MNSSKWNPACDSSSLPSSLNGKCLVIGASNLRRLTQINGLSVRTIHLWVFQHRQSTDVFTDISTVLTDSYQLILLKVPTKYQTECSEYRSECSNWISIGYPPAFNDYQPFQDNNALEVKWSEYALFVCPTVCIDSWCRTYVVGAWCSCLPDETGYRCLMQKPYADALCSCPMQLSYADALCSCIM